MSKMQWFDKEDRWQLMQEGLTQLSQFLDNTAIEGMGSQISAWCTLLRAQAERMVDFKLSGIAKRLRILADQIEAGDEHWPETSIKLIARLYLLCKKIENLSLEELNSQPQWALWAGWNIKKELLQKQTGVRDKWLVMGQRSEKEEKLTLQSTWFWGLNSGKAAVHLDYIFPFTQAAFYWQTGKCYPMELIFYPGKSNLRCIPNRVEKADFHPWPSNAGNTMLEAQTYTSKALQHFPLLDQIPYLLKDVFIDHAAKHDLIIRQGDQAIPARCADTSKTWDALALAGKEPCCIFGEWKNEKLYLLSMGFNGEFHKLH